MMAHEQYGEMLDVLDFYKAAIEHLVCIHEKTHQINKMSVSLRHACGLLISFG